MDLSIEFIRPHVVISKFQPAGSCTIAGSRGGLIGDLVDNVAGTFIEFPISCQRISNLDVAEHETGLSRSCLPSPPAHDFLGRLDNSPPHRLGVMILCIGLNEHFVLTMQFDAPRLTVVVIY